MGKVNLDLIKRIIKQKFDLFYNYLIEHKFSISKDKCLEVINKINKEKDYQFCPVNKKGLVFTVKTNAWEVEFGLISENIKIMAIYDLVEER